MGIIMKQEDGSEIVNYNNESFPSYIFDGYAYKGCTWERIPHYHEDVEIVYVYHGHMGYRVGGVDIELEKGDVLFVNSGVVHYSIAPPTKLVQYIICVLHPRILYSSFNVEMKAIKPIITDKSVTYIHFRNDEHDTPELQEIMSTMLDCTGSEFHITMNFFRIWNLIMNRYTDAYRTHMRRVGEDDEHSKLLKKMMLFIDGNYNNSITLNEIANAGGISISLCNQIFKKLTSKAPIEYVMHYRSRKVADLLMTSDMSMGEIASITGFSSASYMSEIFKKFYSMSPREYKKLARQGSAEKVPDFLLMKDKKSKLI
ncbi:AraC family transcriptional regulator [Eubacterium uniforme]|nr:AraC family transcriptional regulator [Eubacterium uniforme]HAV91437.1 hypothetical protein [Eubacterium sp.]